MHKIRVLTVLVLFVSSVISMEAALAAPPPNDNRADAKNIDVLAYTDTVNIGEATVEQDEPTGAYCPEPQQTVWYRFAAVTDGELVADTLGSDFYAGMAVFRETQQGIDLITCEAGGPVVLTFQAVAGESYLFQGGGIYGQWGNLTFNLSYEGKISGSVTNEAAEPLSSICIDAYRNDYGYWAGGYTNSAGEYQIDGLAAGSYRVRFRDCNYPTRYQEQWYNDKSEGQADAVEVLSGGATNGINAILHPEPPYYYAAASIYPPPCEQDQVSIWLYNGNNYTASDRTFEILIDGTIAYLKTLSPFSSENFSITVPHDDLQHPFEVRSDGSVLASAQAIFRICSDPAVTSFTVTNVALQTDFGETTAYTGWVRRLEAEVQDLTGQGIDAYVEFTVCPKNDPKSSFYGYCNFIYSQYVRVGSAPRVVSYTWNGFGYVGDVTIVARISAAEEHDYSNNSIQRDHYVVLGGTGFGTRVGGCVVIFCV